MSDNLYQSEPITSSSSSATPQLIDLNNNNFTQKTTPRRSQSVFCSTQQDPLLKDRPKIYRRTTSTGSLYNKSSTTLFWDLVGRDNYTISLNSSPVLCNSSSPPEEKEDYFGFSTSF